MSEGITLKRIIDMDEAAELTSSDYALVDSTTGGPKKFAIGQALEEIKDGLTAVESDVTDLKDDFGDLSNLETTDKSNLVAAINEAAHSGGSGLTDTQKELIIMILRNAMYTSDQSGNINDLEDAFARTVVSISVALDLRGNTIYSNDSLDTLRQYLTVRATYDDGTVPVV